MQVIARHAKLDDVQQVFGFLSETALCQGLDHVDDGDLPVLHGFADEGHIARHEASGIVRTRGDDDAPLHVLAGRGEPQFLEHRRDGIDGALAQIERALFGQGRQTAIGFEVALQHQIILELFAIQQRGVEGIVIFEDRAEARADEIGACYQVRPNLGTHPNLGFGRAGVVTRCAFETEPDGDQVLGHQLAHAARNGGGQGCSVNAAVLGSLNPHAPLQAQAARLEIEQRLCFMKPHEQFGTGARRAAHLDAARGVSRRQKSLGPRRVVTIDESFFGAIDRHRLGIGGEARHADLQFLGLFARTLEQGAPAAHGSSHGAGQRVRPGIAGNPHRGFDFIKTKGHRGRRIGC